MNNYDELTHYGVKGMKWGQRRAIKKKAKTTALLNDRKNFHEEAIELNKNKLNKAKLKGKNTEKYKKNIKYNEAEIKRIDKALSKSMKGISKSDIHQAERWLHSSNIYSAFMLGIPGILVDSTIKQIKTDRYINANGR